VEILMSLVGHRLPWKLLCAGVLLGSSVSLLAAPTGAKAIFDSGEGGTIGMSAGAARPAAPVVAAAPVAAATPARYVGISYQILSIADDGQMRPVSKNRIFRSGERVKILARTNRSGYLTVANIGSSGRMHVLFNDYVEGHRPTEIPPNTNLRFDGNPGTEQILIMLSNEPSPFAAPGAGRAVNQAAAAPPPAPSYTPPPPSGSQWVPPAPMADAGTSSVAVPSYPLPPEQAGATMMASLGGAKSLKAKGAKDLMVEDSMQSSYAVVSPRQGFKAVSGGAKDLIMESSPDGMNYGLVPAAAIAGGGILTLEIKLTHR
jgi:hypothetical protein